MTDKVDMKQLAQNYARTMKFLAKQVGELEEQADDVRGRQEQRKASQQRIAASQREMASLEGERSDLQTAYMSASFEGDKEAMKEVQERRAEIDNRVAELENDIREERASLPHADGEHCASVVVARDRLRPIKIEDLISRLTEVLQEDAKEINERIRSISVDSSAYSREDYDKQRAAVDASYAIQLSQNRRLAAKEAEKRKKMRPISSTDEMHAIQAKRRKPQPTVSVTSDDSNTGTLSGDEVRRILREKQTA